MRLRPLCHASEMLLSRMNLPTLAIICLYEDTLDNFVDCLWIFQLLHYAQRAGDDKIGCYLGLCMIDGIYAGQGLLIYLPSSSASLADDLKALT